MQERKVSARKMAAHAVMLIQHHFGKKKVTATPLAGGISNHVFLTKHGREELVVRLSTDPNKLEAFQKEQWAVAKAKEKGVPVPEILEVGNTIIPLPYMIVRKIDGEEATHHIERSSILQEAAEYTSLIHTIPTKHYGHQFDWSQNTLAKNETWKDYLVKEFRAYERLNVLQKHRMLKPGTSLRVRGFLKKMMRLNDEPCLHHGDIRLKNLLVNKKGKIIAIIDWENCISSIAPFWDLSIALHDLAIDRQAFFLEGYKLSSKQTVQIAPFVKVFNILNYSPEIERIVASKDRERLEHYRARLHGALDMFSL